MRILAEAGVLPEEFALKKARAAYATAAGDTARKAAVGKRADLGLRYAIARETRRKSMS